MQTVAKEPSGKQSQGAQTPVGVLVPICLVPLGKSLSFALPGSVLLHL